MNKCICLYVLQGCYDHCGWKDIFTFENYGLAREAIAILKVYRKKEKGRYRIIKLRKLNNDYSKKTAPEHLMKKATAEE